MSNGGGVAILALIIGIGAIAVGIYSAFFVPTSTLEQASEQTSEQIDDETKDPIFTNIWTVEQESTYYTSTSYAEVPDMDETIEVDDDETVYITFNAEFETDTGSTWLVGGVRIMIDNVKIDGSERSFTIQGGGGIITACSHSTEVIIEDLDEGEYEIELQVTSQAGSGTESMKDGLLMIYTFEE